MNDILDDDEDFEELYGEWDPRLYHAAMADKDRHFAVLVGGPRWDDPYTIILTRDTVEQTFSRSDVRRELRDIRVVPSDDESAAPSYVTVSLQGDIYLVGPGGSQHFTIPDTPASVPDGPTMYFSSILPYADRWLVAGTDGFLKAGKDQTWDDVAPTVEVEHPYSKTEWTILDINRSGQIYIVGTQRPSPRSFNLYPGHPLYRDDMSEDERFELQKKLQAEQQSYPVLNYLFTGVPGNWKRHELPKRIASTLPAYAWVSYVVPDERGSDYIVGSDGLVMLGTPESGFAEISSLPDREKNYSNAALYKGELLLAADSELFRFDGHLAKTFTPKVNLRLGSKRVQPSSIFARENRLHVFDYGNRIFSFVDGEWKEYVIPGELTERPFKGDLR